MIPRTAIGAGPTRATLAVMAGARSVRAVALACGWKSTSHAYENLCVARHRGLVAWEPGMTGTLRPLVAVVT